MKLKFATGCFVIASLLTPLAAHADSAEKTSTEKTKTYVKDSVITTKVKAKLAEEKMASLVNIKVDTTQQGLVVLSGNVKSQEEMDKAVAIARGTEGVTSVKNDLQIKKD